MPETPTIKSPKANERSPRSLVTSVEPSPYQLDVTKLHTLPSEQQGLYLLTFTADLVHHVDALDADAVSAEQASLKKELLQIINLSSPPPTRVIRNNLGKCFAGIFGKGNRKLLYESINDLVAIVNAGKEKDSRTKHAAVTCVGVLFEAAGDSAISLSPLACSSLLKAIKGSASETGLRGAIFRALGRILNGINSSIDEDIGRTIWKQARGVATTDRSYLVQKHACWCLEQLIRTTSYFDNSNDFEKLQSVVWKAMESPSTAVRHAAASCLAAELIKSFVDTQSKDVVPLIRKPRKTKKAVKPEDLDDTLDRASSPAPDKPATALSYTLSDMLRILSSQYCKPGTTLKARAGIVVCYIKMFKALGEGVLEQKYGDIARHFFAEILSHPSMQFNRYRQLISRKFVAIMLEQVIGRTLGETAQLNACRFLLNDIIKDYPHAVKERPEPTKHALIGALSAVTAMIREMDSAINTIGDLCREALLQVLPHPSYTVQIYAARGLRAFVLACPQQLLPTVTICMNSVNRELNLLAGPRQAPRRCVGYAHGLAAVLSASDRHPLYGALDVYARVLQQATSLLKSSGSSDLRISSCQLQVAWIMIGGLMSLGPNFVKIHLAQLMLLWKNALPKPVGRENMSQRNMIELSYLGHVRECALASIKAFLTFNQRLLTSDISRRLSAMLENTVAFLQGLPEKKTSDDPSNRLSPTLQLQDYEVMVRRRLFQCFAQLLVLSPSGSIEETACASLLPLAVRSFADVEYYTPSSLSAAIAGSAASFESLWDVSDNYGFGVTSLVRGLDVQNPITRSVVGHWSTRQSDETSVDRATMTPMVTSPEYDATCCYLPSGPAEDDLPASPWSEAVNAAIAVFALAFPLQPHRVQESLLDQISAAFSPNVLQKDPARKAAIAVNVALALTTTCKVVTGEVGSVRGDLTRDASAKALQALLHLGVQDPDAAVRAMAADAIGRLCKACGSAFTVVEVSHLTDTIVQNPNPHVRVGCALSLASIHAQLGGLAAGFHMNTIIGILMSLAADTHPLVHFWALDSLAQVAASAGPNFSAYVTSTIGMLSQLYASDGHNAETTSLASSNMSIELPVAAAVARGVDATIHVLGPDLQDMTKARDMILTLVRLFSGEDSDDLAVLLESLRCMEHLAVYTPGHLEFAKHVQRLQADIESDSSEIAAAALQGLAALMRRDAPEIIHTARPGLEERLWEFLNVLPHQPAIRNIFVNWLHQTGASDPAGWIHRCNNILTKTQTRAAATRAVIAKSATAATATATATVGPDLQDDEVAGFALSAGGGGVGAKDENGDASAPTSTQELMRWQVRQFAMECLQNLIAMITKEAAVMDESPGEAALQHQVGDVIRIAFSASTAGVARLRVVGMQIIDQILKMFGRTPDPDFPEAMLLEQYQAQISSALTPAFAADSSPELAAAAVSVCATFVATGIVTDVDRMGRILRVLVAALDSFSLDPDTARIGDLRALGANAQVMVRMAVFAAWAQLQIASVEQRYLSNVVRPHVARLVPLWLASLREYARLRFEPDISASLGGGSGGNGGVTSGGVPSMSQLDTIYAALNRQTLLKFYQDSWLSLVDAIASLIDEDSEFVFDALDSKHIDDADADVDGHRRPADGVNANSTPQVNGLVKANAGVINYREEPVAFFFVLFGLAFESLAVRTNEDDLVVRQRNLDILQAVKKILRPSVSGNAVYQEIIFNETMDLLDRMVLTESLSVQAIIVDIARNLCMAHPSSRKAASLPNGSGDHLTDDIEQLFELTRIIVLVLAGLVPGLSDSPVSARLESSDEATALVRTAIQALVDVADVFPTIIKTDLHATLLHIFVTVLGTGTCQAAVVPQTLPIFRRFIASLATSDRDDESTDTFRQLGSVLVRMLSILKYAQRRETPSSLPCEKNVLLAITILLSTAPDAFPPHDAHVIHFISELFECLTLPPTSRVAAGCVRTLLLAGRHSSRLVQPSLLFLSQPLNHADLDESRGLMAQTLVLFAARLPTSRRPAAVAAFTSALLARARHDGSDSYLDTGVRLLELGGIDAAAFRAVIGRMGPDSPQKKLVEQILKAHAGSQRSRVDPGADHEPTIQLKMNFGG